MLDSVDQRTHVLNMLMAQNDPGHVKSHRLELPPALACPLTPLFDQKGGHVLRDLPARSPSGNRMVTKADDERIH
jgi:hypothetical protein